MSPENEAKRSKLLAAGARSARQELVIAARGDLLRLRIGDSRELVRRGCLPALRSFVRTFPAPPDGALARLLALGRESRYVVDACCAAATLAQLGARITDWTRDDAAVQADRIDQP